jgi:tRNA U34 5-methylaminomethyl-2-thiouridine-forming methyltransferase MnmC
MYAQQLSSGPTSVARALAKMEHQFQQKEATGYKQFLATKKHFDMPAYAHFIQENMPIIEQIIKAAPIQQSNTDILKIEISSWRRFSNILNQVSNAKEGISRQECLFVQQFWSELQKL